MPHKPGPGRPPKPPRLRRTQRLQILLTPAEHRCLSKHARERNIAVNELVRSRIVDLLREAEAG